jgi:NAD(P)-dependent dehydrogenase (short-subunit alcohol dehydrogenase family)
MIEGVSKLVPRFDLKEKVVLISGAGRGIGRACALACAGAGAHVAVGLRDVPAADKLIAELKNFGRQVLPVKLDITSRADVAHAIDRVLDTFSRIDVLINNVGVGPDDRAEDVTEANFDFTVDVNLKGTFFLTQAVGRKMIAQKSGRIVNISSQAGTVALLGESIYCMTKAAINHLTRCLALEWAPHNITVNSVSPTFIWTDGTAPALADPEFRQRTLAHIPLGRIGDPLDVAGAVVFLASPAASLITGANLLVDGGWSVA